MPRPRWRLAAGGATLGVGALISGFGISALVADGDCTADVVSPVRACGFRFDTKTTGGALLGAGLAVSAAGAILLSITPQLGSGQFALSVTPVDVDGDGSVTNNAALQLVAQSAVWNYTNAPDAVGGTGSQPRGGLAFGTSTGSITRAEFEGATIAVGLVASGRGIGSCEFRDLRITAR